MEIADCCDRAQAQQIKTTLVFSLLVASGAVTGLTLF